MDTKTDQRPTDILLPPEAAHYVRLAVPTLGKMRCWGGGPEFLKLGRKVAYQRAALDDWLAARAARSTSDAARLPVRLTESHSSRLLVRDAPRGRARCPSPPHRGER
jgi:hypothetical protein